MGRMLLAFRRAEPAGVGTGPELRPDELPVGGGDARDNARGGKTDIGAVEIGANADDLFGNFIFSEAGVGARIAGFGAGVAGGDTLDGASVIGRRLKGVRVEHLFDVTHKFQFAERFDEPRRWAAFAPSLPSAVRVFFGK
jgi:hypothetical protein